MSWSQARQYLVLTKTWRPQWNRCVTRRRRYGLADPDFGESSFYLHPVKGLCQKLATIRGNALECDAPRRQCRRNGCNFAAAEGNLRGSNASGTRAKIRGEIETRSIGEQRFVEHRRRPSVVVLDVAVIGQLHELYRWGRM